MDGGPIRREACPRDGIAQRRRLKSRVRTRRAWPLFRGRSFEKARTSEKARLQGTLLREGSKRASLSKRFRRAERVGTHAMLEGRDGATASARHHPLQPLLREGALGARLDPHALRRGALRADAPPRRDAAARRTLDAALDHARRPPTDRLERHPGVPRRAQRRRALPGCAAGRGRSAKSCSTPRWDRTRDGSRTTRCSPTAARG